MLTTTASAKPCRACPKTFVPVRPLQAVCSPRCAQREVTRKRKEDEAREKAKFKARKDAARPLAYWAKQAQDAFNAWCRCRDRELGCISCGTTTGAFDAGHFRSVGSCPELRFDEANVNKQCAMNCNHNKGGNVLEYRKGLIAKRGQAEVDRLEGPHEPKRYRAHDLRAIRDEYRKRLKTESPGGLKEEQA